MNEDKWAIITVTNKGVEKSIEISKKCEKSIKFDIFTIEKYQTKGIKRAYKDFKELVKEIYYLYDTILFIMASGIVVRMIAPYIQSKVVDPAILVMDDNGNNVISLLSGHIGGANMKTKILANLIDAKPIITTSSDVNNKIAVDTFAIDNDLFIENLTDAKDITALILNEENIILINEDKIQLEEKRLPSNVTIDNIENIHKYKGAILITRSRRVNIEMPFVQLIPKNIVIGIGCRRDMPAHRIIDFIESALEELDIRNESIKTISTVDVKENEKGILETVGHYKANIEIISRQNIIIHEDKFNKSNFVKETIGVANVCEPCGFISSKGGNCILGKKVLNGITLSVWELKNN
ncbi:MAG: cobalt-precorrin 5A hydrolase [Eubacteriaceae bacterium]